MQKFPTLYKRSEATGKIEVWNIKVIEHYEGLEDPWAEIEVSYGEMDGKVQTPKPDAITEGKNIGRSNETSAIEQAYLEAAAKHEKKRKSGYISSLERALRGETDAIIKGGANPMLAHLYRDHADKVIFPCAIQPKLDGIRCIAIKRGNSVSLWTRKRIRITSCPHIEEAVAQLDIEEVVLDGELYNHELKHKFSLIQSAVRRGVPSELSRKVQYHIYDIVETKDDFEGRNALLSGLMPSEHPDLIYVDTTWANDAEDIENFMAEKLQEGYEGAIIRNTGALYQPKRTKDMLKLKAWHSSEFRIIGAEEGRGKLQGKLGKWVCTTKSGEEFRAAMKCSEAQKEKYWVDQKKFIGKWLEVQYMNLGGETVSGKISDAPRHGVGLRIRLPSMGL